MQRGDLSTDPLRSLLPQLAAEGATGCLYVTDPAGGEISVYLDAAELVGVLVPDAADRLGSRLVTRGELSAEILQRLATDTATTASLAERIVAERLVDESLVDAVQLELAVETVDRILDWTSGAWRFRRRQRPKRPLADPIPVAVLLEDARRRAEVTSPAIADPATGSAADEPDADGDGEPDIEPAIDEASRTTGWNRVAADDDVLEYLARASVALNDALGDATEDDDSGQASTLIRSLSATSTPAAPVDPATAARRERLRTAAAAELAAAHAESEQARRDHEAQRAAEDRADAEPAPTRPRRPSGPQGDDDDHAAVVDLGARRQAARAARELAELSRTSAREPSPEPAAAGPGAEVASSVAEVAAEPAEPEPEPVEPAPARAAAPSPAAAASPAPAPAGPHPWQTSTDDHLAATALLREMAGDSSQAPAPTQRPAEPEPASAVERAPAASGLRRPNAPGGSADTAALLRELSSLGGDDAPTRSPTPSAQPRPSGAHAAANRRRKGLWGRS